MDMLHSMATYLGEEADVALQASGHLLALVPHAVLQLLYVGLGPDLLLLHPPGCCQGLGDSEWGPEGPEGSRAPTGQGAVRARRAVWAET